jgi:hypothetical protein
MAECLLRSSVYADYMTAARMTAMQLSRARAALAAVPDLGAAAAGTTCRSPGTTRLKDKVTDIGVGVDDATGRIEELIGYLNGLAEKYEGLFQLASAREEMLAKMKDDG